MTVYHARIEKQNEWNRRFGAAEAARDALNASLTADRAFAHSHPEIGELCREGKTVWYVYPVNGEYRESTNPRDLVRA